MLEDAARRPVHGDFLGIGVLEGRFDLLGDGLAPRHRRLPERVTDLRPTAIGATATRRCLIEDLTSRTDILHRLLNHLDPIEPVQAFFEHANTLLEVLCFGRVGRIDRIGHQRKSKQG